MARQRHTAEQIIGKLREVEVGLGGGRNVVELCRSIGVAKQTYYRWRAEYSGLKLDQAKRLKELERENARLKQLDEENVRLKKLVADLSLDKEMLQDVIRRKM